MGEPIGEPIEEPMGRTYSGMKRGGGGGDPKMGLCGSEQQGRFGRFDGSTMAITSWNPSGVFGSIAHHGSWLLV